MKAHKRIRDYIAMNKDKFGNRCFFCNGRPVYSGIELEPTHEGFYHDVRKKIIDGETYEYVCVFRPGVLQNILVSLGFSDANVVLYQMRKHGYLKSRDNKRNTSRYIINDYQLDDCIAVYIKLIDVPVIFKSIFEFPDTFNE